MTSPILGPEAPEAVRATVRERYGKIAAEGTPCCGPESVSSACCGEGSGNPCCGEDGPTSGLSYPSSDLAGLPEGAELGLGCGNPTALLSLLPGETVLDLGSGGGVDCFLASRKVGPTGRVIGVDMTPEMIALSRGNALKGGYGNVEFRLGEIEHLPAADRSVDVVISNCVINLALDKRAVYGEAFRVLRPGGRLAVADVVATRPIAAELRRDPELWSSCSSGALPVGEILPLLHDVGFTDVHVESTPGTESLNSLANQARLGVVPASIRATKPAAE